MANTNNSGNGIGFGTLLFLVFLVLKLTNYIDWSWWWITAPLWVSVIIILGVVTLVSYLNK
tara:strand:- start:171 stop:353 length:183 start_codon:yes stop_codon:yes gene_type:complete